MRTTKCLNTHQRNCDIKQHLTDISVGKPGRSALKNPPCPASSYSTRPRRSHCSPSVGISMKILLADMKSAAIPMACIRLGPSGSESKRNFKLKMPWEPETRTTVLARKQPKVLHHRQQRAHSRSCIRYNLYIMYTINQVISYELMADEKDGPIHYNDESVLWSLMSPNSKTNIVEA